MERSYKLQEFVAHGGSNVTCLKISKKTSRMIVTGGEDHKVNIWSVARPDRVMSLSGHSSAVNSVTFDNEEALVAAGSASGTIKLWDLEEAKIMRTLSGHRLNCIAMDFHPFGEFFASGSRDTNLKIWDIRRKRCIHTYKGHDHGINAVKFSPDGRWVVSGGEDNVAKVWDLTAGKLMHDFTCHQDQILCVEFHPHEFLLATGSVDKTVKFWDLETFELIGSAGPEMTGVHSLVFNPDGRTLLAGLQEHMKVFSWEPLRCHDVVDVGWSKIADLTIQEGKLLGCSYSKSSVGIWVVDLSCIGPYAFGSHGPLKGTPIIKQSSQRRVDGRLKSSNLARNISPCDVESAVEDIKLNTTKKYNAAVRDEDQYVKAIETSCIGSIEIRQAHYVPNVNNKDSGAERGMMSMREHGLRASGVDAHSFVLRRNQGTMEKASSLTIDDAKIIDKLMEDHNSFTSSMQSRLTNLQVIRQFRIRNDLKGAVEAMGKIADQSVLVDVLSCWMDRSELFTLEVSGLLLPLLNGLLSSAVERYLSTALSVLSMIVKNFGHVIHTTRTTSLAFGIDFQAQERIERCNACYADLQIIMQNLIPLMRKGGDIGKAAQDLNVHLQDV